MEEGGLDSVQWRYEIFVLYTCCYNRFPTGVCLKKHLCLNCLEAITVVGQGTISKEAA